VRVVFHNPKLPPGVGNQKLSCPPAEREKILHPKMKKNQTENSAAGAEEERPKGEIRTGIRGGPIFQNRTKATPHLYRLKQQGWATAIRENYRCCNVASPTHAEPVKPLQADQERGERPFARGSNERPTAAPHHRTEEKRPRRSKKRKKKRPGKERYEDSNSTGHI